VICDFERRRRMRRSKIISLDVEWSKTEPVLIIIKVKVLEPNDRVFQILEQYPDYVPVDELSYLLLQMRKIECKDLK